MKIIFYTFILSYIALLNGCSTTMGSFNPSTHFAYNNSDILPLGYVNVSVKDHSFIFPPKIDKERMVRLLEDALAQKPGADMIINYKLDTTVTVVPIPFLSIYSRTITLEGTAAKMIIGRQEIKKNY